LNATCTATITQVNPFVDSVVVTIVLGSARSSVPLQDSRPRSKPWRLPLFGFGVLLTILMAFRLAHQTRLRPRLLYAGGFLLAVLLTGISGCTSASLVNGGGGGAGGGTPVGNFVIKVNVTAGNFSTTVPLSLTVTK
jgi:hypothetical protein